MPENGRHQACRAWRERKVKCDGGQPKCRRCARHGQDCSYAPPATSRRYSKADFSIMLANMNQRLYEQRSPGN
ncbi:hypothetical protein PG996_002847 [Apiospora saccharicola]|uniref:Zn(2)-C6 fungal-type domain-containing protein n=1 Tax=Apiospora saccharicola TaxID=335842 RepID=A0ABR1WNL4_9PEZI